MPAACRAASAAHMRRGVERQPRLSSHPCHARRRAPCAPVGALAVLHQPARRGAMHPGHCVGRQPACLSTEQERMLRTLAQHQLASNQALSPLHSRPRAPAAALLNTEAQEPPLVVAALCSAACEQRSARPTPGTPGRLWDGGPPSECEPHRRPCLPQPRASSSKRQHRACFSETSAEQAPLVARSVTPPSPSGRGGTTLPRQRAPRSCTVFVMTPPNEHTSEGGRDDRGVPYHAESTLSGAQESSAQGCPQDPKEIAFCLKKGRTRQV